jgi:hypothetical protein
VKVAYLLVTTVCLMGAQQPTGPKDGVKDTTPPKVVQPAPVSGDCGCNSCNTCDSCGSSCWDRFKSFCSGLCRRNSCDSCGSTCGSSCGGCATARPSCFSGCAAQSCNTCNTGCNDSCGCGSSHRFRDFCRGLFHRNDCCDTCNSGCGGTVIVPKGAEQIPPPKDGAPPKEMPKGGEPPQKQVQILNQGQPLPVPAPTFDAPPAAPAITPANPNQERPF